MTPEAQRIAIAEACGWTKVPNSRGKRWCRHYLCLGPHHSLGSLPDYLSDLNAMRDAWNAMKVIEREDFFDELAKLIPATEGMSGIANAKASLRAEAFLRTLNLWQQ